MRRKWPLIAALALVITACAPDEEDEIPLPTVTPELPPTTAPAEVPPASPADE